MNFERSVDTKTLISVLAEAEIGQMVTYETMSAAIGRDVRQHSLPSLRSARRFLLKEKGFVFGTETNVGYRRLDDSQIVESTRSDRKRVYRASKRSLEKLGAADFSRLSEDKKREHIVSSAQLMVIKKFSEEKTHKKIESRVNSSADHIPIGETLKMFS